MALSDVMSATVGRVLPNPLEGIPDDLACAPESGWLALDLLMGEWTSADERRR